ncbi:MAG: hypothetical protein JXR73_20225 [Candidatus Omnitrophica bacterium]|nr:hypothetical protein [Candidatus Omnitrophota bacterium]
MKNKLSPVLIALFLIGISGSGAWPQVGIFDKAVDWPQIGSFHVEGEARLEGAGADEKYRVFGNGSFGVRIEGEGYGVEGDEGYFLYTDRSGSWTLEAKLFPWWGPSALMIREVGDDPASNFYSVQFGGQVGDSVNALFRTRTGAGGNVTEQLFGPDGEPIADTGDGMWFRVTRVEPVDIFFGEYSPDGNEWYIADSRVIDWPSDTASFGIAVGSGADDEEIGEVEVSSVSFVSPPPAAKRSISGQSFKANETLDVQIKVYISGEDRSTATITETPPEGWTISQISHNGVESNGNIEWTLENLPVGETVLTYKAAAPAAPDDFASWSGEVEESVNIISPMTLPFLNITGGDRVTDDLILLYTFYEGEGDVVHDVSGVGEPMDLQIEDITRVYWGDGYLETTGVNHIETQEPAVKIIDACRASNEITLEGWIKTSDIQQNGPARIITCSIDAADRNFTMGQGHFGAPGSQLEMRFRTDINPDNPLEVRSSWTGGGTFSEALTHVVFVRNEFWDLFAYINNEIMAITGGDGEFIEGDFSTWDETYKFGLGNEVSAARAWYGQFHLVALYNRALSEEEISQNYNAGPFIGDDVSVSDWALY